MKRTLKVILGLLATLAVLVCAFIWGYAPLRDQRLEVKNARFMAEFRARAKEIDSKFNHHDTVVNGIKWHYVDQGPKEGTAIVFLHGLPEGWYSWRYVLPLLDPKYRLIAPDMKGYGRSDKEDNNYDWHVVARQTLEFVTSLGIDKFYVVGHDWGSLIGSVLVSDHPRRILGYVRMQADLLRAGTVMNWFKKPQFLLFQSHWLASYMMRDAEWFIDRVYPPRMKKPFDPVDRSYFINEFSRAGVAEQVPRYFKTDNWDLEAALDRICKGKFFFPIMILQADGDPAQPVSIFEDVPHQCPGVELRWIKNASHFSNLDQPEEVARAINEFVNRAK